MPTHTPIIYLDIETFAGDTKPSLDEIDAPANYVDPVKIQAYKENNLDKAYRKQALNSMKGVIVLICYSIDDGEVQSITGTEKDIMTKFADVIAEYPYSPVCGHNIRRFDLVWLWHRAVRYRLKHLTVALPHSKQEYERIIDTMEIFSASSYGSDSWISLDTLAKFLGLETKEFSGSEVHDLYLNNQMDKIVDHCKADVELCRTIYNLTK